MDLKCIFQAWKSREKRMKSNFIFWSKYFALFENWKHSPCHRAKYAPKRLRFQHFLVYNGKYKFVMKKSLSFIAQFLYFSIQFSVVSCVSPTE